MGSSDGTIKTLASLMMISAQPGDKFVASFLAMDDYFVELGCGLLAKPGFHKRRFDSFQVSIRQAQQSTNSKSMILILHDLLHDQQLSLIKRLLACVFTFVSVSDNSAAGNTDTNTYLKVRAASNTLVAIHKKIRRSISFQQKISQHPS